MKKEKCTEEIKLHVGEQLKADMKRDAARLGFESLSTYVRYIMTRHLYGHLNPNQDLLAGTVKDD